MKIHQILWVLIVLKLMSIFSAMNDFKNLLVTNVSFNWKLGWVKHASCWIYTDLSITGYKHIVHLVRVTWAQFLRVWLEILGAFLD